MSISGYAGLSGHGKSYGVVQNVILPALRAGRLVYTNIPMNHDACIKDFGLAPTQFETADIVKNPNWWTEVFQAGSVLVLDEVATLWPSGLRANSARKSDQEFLTQHRHFVGENGFSTEIYLITQDFIQIATFVRALIETTYRMVKLTNLGFDKRFRVDIYTGCVTGQKPPISKREREIHGGKFKKEVYQYYVSHTKSQSGFAGDETRVDGRANAFSRLSIKLGFALFIVCLIFFFWGIKKVFSYYGGASSSSHATAPVKDDVDLAPSNDPKVFRNSTARRSNTISNTPPFLQNAKTIFVSHSIALNKAKPVFYFNVVFPDYSVILSSFDLVKMGYTVEPMTDCVFRLIGYDFSGYAMCKPNEKPKGVLASLGQEVVQQPVSSH